MNKGGGERGSNYKSKKRERRNEENSYLKVDGSLTAVKLRPNVIAFKMVRKSGLVSAMRGQKKSFICQKENKKTPLT